MRNAEQRQTRQLSSDTFASLCPEAIQAIAEANHGHAAPYGDDPWTARATQLLRELFETDCAVFFVPTGTAANALALAAMCNSYHSVLCHADAHIQTDECGAPEYAGRGLKLVPIAGEHGKLTPATIKEAAALRSAFQKQPVHGRRQPKHGKKLGEIRTFGRRAIQMQRAPRRRIGRGREQAGADVPGAAWGSPNHRRDRP